MKRGWLLVVPALGVALTIWLATAFGPFWIGPNYDPEYVYLVNSLGLLEGHAPVHTDHPGTPLQLLGAAVIGTVHMLADGNTELARSVLTDPEKYLDWIRAVLVALWVVATIVIGVVAAERTGSVLGAVLVQAAPLLSLQGALSLTRASPEPLLLALSILVGAMTLRRSSAVSSPDGRRSRSIALGGLLGLGVATKVTFFPVGAYCLLFVRSAKARITLTVAAFAAFFLAVSPIFIRWESVVRWFGKLVLGTETYGEGPRTIINPTRYSHGFAELLSAEPVLFGFAAASLVTVILLGRAKPEARDNSTQLRAALMGVAIAELLQIAITAKYPVPRYLIPAIGLLGVNAALLWTALPSVVAAPSRRALKLAFPVATIAVIAYQAYRVSDARTKLARRRDGAVQLAALANRVPDRVLAFGYGSSGEGPALWFANTWAKNRYSAILEELHPRTIEYHLGWKVFLSHGNVLPESQIAEWAKEGRLLVQVTESNIPKSMRLQPIARAGSESLNRAVQ